MPKLKYIGQSTIREVSQDNLENAGVYEHEAMFVRIDTRDGDRARIVDVSQATADLLLDKEPADWYALTDEESADVDKADAEKEKRLAEKQAEAEAAVRERDEAIARMQAAREAQANEQQGQGNDQLDLGQDPNG